MANVLSKCLSDVRRIFKKDASSGTMRSILRIMSGSTNVWKRQTKLTFMVNDGTTTVHTTLSLPTGSRIGSYLSSITTPTRTGWTFTGWKDSASSTIVHAGTLVTNDDMVLNAVWEVVLPENPFGSGVSGSWKLTNSTSRIWTYTGYMNYDTSHRLTVMAFFYESTLKLLRGDPEVHDPKYDLAMYVPWIHYSNGDGSKGMWTFNTDVYRCWTTDGYVYTYTIDSSDVATLTCEDVETQSSEWDTSGSSGTTPETKLESKATYLKFKDMLPSWEASVTLYLGAGTSGSKGYIDWGDGTTSTISESTSVTTVSHTWAAGVVKLDYVRVAGTWKYVALANSSTTSAASERPLIAVCHYSAAGSLPTYAYANQPELVWANLEKATGTNGNYAFYNCPSLKEVNMPLITALGSYMCYGCSSINSILCASATALPAYLVGELDATSVDVYDILIGGKAIYSLISGSSLPSTWKTSLANVVVWGSGGLGKEFNNISYIAFRY